jgi:tetratricopeptide (TPR) repeat protein
MKVIFFDEGFPVFAAGNVRKERLGEDLLSLGRITDDDFARASAFVEPDGTTRFGDALIRAGIMDKDDVGASVTHWVERTLVSLFALKAGSAFFEERACPIPADYRVSLSVAQVLRTGISSMNSRELVLAGLGDLDRPVVLAANSPFDVDDTCSEDEAEVLKEAATGVSIRELASENGALAFARLRAVYALLSSGILQELQTADAPATSSLADIIRREVDDDLERSAHFDCKEWLQVPATAPREDQVAALESKVERYQALLAATTDDDLRTDIELVLGRASSMLRIARRPATAPAAVPSPVVSTRATSPMPSMEIDHLLMEGNVRLSVGDFANAVDAYARLVELRPDDPSLRVRLAVSMAHWPPTAKQADRQFTEAVKMDPDNADLHYQFGLYYKAMKVPSRAIVEFRIALRLDPRHSGAAEEMEGLGMKDSVLGALKKKLRR